ncbi:hypothetical protein V8E54_010488 [Elaphomyces granulatus]
MSVIRHQVPLTPAWAIRIIKYKVLHTTLSQYIDLHRQDKTSKDSANKHKRYCSTYVQLSRVKSLQGLYLLQSVTLSDLNGKPDQLLVQEDERIAQLATSTVTETWTGISDGEGSTMTTGFWHWRLI